VVCRSSNTPVKAPIDTPLNTVTNTPIERRLPSVIQIARYFFPDFFCARISIAAQTDPGEPAILNTPACPITIRPLT
jgi:hypothetical protein